MAGGMEGIRAFLLALLVLLGIAVAPTGTSSAAGPAQLAPAPATATPAAKDGGQPAWRIVPASSFTATETSSSKEPFFRGGVRSRAGAPSSAAPAPRAPTASPRIAVYNGLNKPGETSALNPGFTPPDSTGAIGPNHYVEMANESIAVYSRSLNLMSRASLATLVGVANPWCDPQIQWDPAANRWLFVVLHCNTNPNAQDFVVGWSKTPDPSTLSPAGWCSYDIGTNPDLLDYPKLGHNSRYLIVGGNFYDMSVAGQPFVGSEFAWIPLPAIGDTSCAAITLQHTAVLVDLDGHPAFTPVPVNTITNATDGYVLAAYDPAGNNGVAPGARTKLAAWHVDSAGALHQDTDITVTSYTMPSAAPQPPNGSPAHVIDTLDGRLTQAVGDPASGMWTQHTVNGLGGRSMVAWYKITASGSATTLADAGTIADPTDFVFNAAISPRFDGLGAAIEYNRSSSTTFPTIAAQIRLASTTAGMMEPGELVLATSPAFDSDGSCNFGAVGVPCRWGDYSAATPDPVQTNVVWGTNEFNTASGNTPAWSDENFALLVAVAPHAPTAVAATARDRSARVAWTPSAFDPGAPTLSYKLTAYVGASPVATLTVPAPAVMAIFTGLTNGTTYTFTVIAINAIGPSLESTPSNTVTPGRDVLQGPPGTPGNRTGVNQGPHGTPSPR
jgi:hypothetical protein